MFFLAISVVHTAAVLCARCRKAGREAVVGKEHLHRRMISSLMLSPQNRYVRNSSKARFRLAVVLVLTMERYILTKELASPVECISFQVEECLIGRLLRPCANGNESSISKYFCVKIFTGGYAVARAPDDRGAETASNGLQHAESQNDREQAGKPESHYCFYTTHSLLQ